MLKQTPTKRVLFVRRLTPVLLALVGVFSFILANFHSPQLAYATAANTINFQARLQSSAGAIVPDGNYNVEFKLYDASSGGTLLWTEDYTATSGPGSSDERLQTVNGYFSANLGSVNPFPATIDWSQQLYLTMNIGGTGTGNFPGIGDGEMNPRMALTSVPYAFQSARAAKADQLSFISGGNTSTLSFQNPTVDGQNFILQDQGAAGTYNLLTKNQADSSYLQLQTSTPGTAQHGNLNIDGTALVGGVSISGNLLMTGSSSTISNPQGSIGGEAFGAGASVTTFRSTAVGNGATASGNDSVVFGYNADSGIADEAVVIGAFATCINNGCVAIGKSASSGYSDIVIGDSASVSGNESVVIGNGSSAFFKGVAIGNGATVGSNNSMAIGHGATTTASNQLVIGGSTADGAPVSNVYIGSGVIDTTPNDVTIHATGADTGTADLAGASISIAGGAGTGTGNGGNINLQIAQPGATGSTANPLATVASLSGINGSAVFKNATDSSSAFDIQNTAGTALLGISTIHNTTDLSTNGNFEQNATGWAGKGSATVSRVTTQAYIGSGSLQTVTTAAIGDGAEYPVTLATNTQYTMSFYAKLSSGSLSISYGYNNGSSDTDCKTGQGVKTTGWQIFNCTFTTPGTVSAGSHLYWKQPDATARTVWTDAFQYVAGSDIGAYYDGKINTGGTIFSGPVAIQNDNNSQTSFQVQDNAGQSLFGIDSLNDRVGISMLKPQATLDVGSLSNTSVLVNLTQSGSNNADILDLSKFGANGGKNVLSVASTGATLFQNNTDSASGFDIQNASGSSIFTVNTSSSVVAITGTGTATVALQAPSFDTASAGALSIGGTNATSILFGNSTNGITFTTGGGFVASGTAQHSKTINLNAEYAGAVLDPADGTCTSANNGTMTSGYDGTNFVNYYKWVGGASAQCYDVVVRVALPTDFAGWTSSTPLTLNSYTSDTTNGTIKVEMHDTANFVNTSCNFANVTPVSTGTWSSSNSGNCTVASGTYNAGGVITIRIRMSGNTGSDTRIGNLSLSYQSKF